MNENRHNDANSVEIYIAVHKKCTLPLLDGYVPLEVGAALRDKDLGFLTDHTGLNISLKNKNYCELTACYWIWKHSKANIVGLVHYRRFLSKYRINVSQKYFLSVNKAKKILKNHDIILPEVIYWKNYNVAEAYDHGSGFKKDLDTIKDIITRHYPEYTDTYNKILSGHKGSYCNVMVCPKNIYDLYCTWLFDILFEAEKRIDIRNYTESEARIWGYLSEILLNVWVEHNNLKIYHMPLVRIGERVSRKRKLLSLVEKIPFSRPVIRYCMIYKFNKDL